MTGFMAEGLTASILAGLVTGAGGFLTFFKAVYSKDDINLMLNTAAGVMLAAAFFSLMDPALTGLKQLLPGSGGVCRHESDRDAERFAAART